MDDSESIKISMPAAVKPHVPQEERPLEQCMAEAKMLMVELEGGLSDGLTTLGPDGAESLSLYRADILGLEAWVEAGRKLVLLARPDLALAEPLAQRLGASLRTTGGDKDILFKQVIWENEIIAAQAAYMGRDMDDLPALGLAGLAVCPPESPEWVKGVCHIVTGAPAGRGAVRELVDRLLADYVPEDI
ncbi:MAG: hypothetical protein K9K66_16925 [Desulfarculaceae bacterium]|nr:hypothetical protein [Desulfarculaceae bacterium]MCF8072585.1 hypothetical protein [Desulfarculaceae bacterium]MCF8103343.1 hypothetical protein [Desulfarculaceae bacterium]MCF8117494.1 hypothetical protein [Desulfarculaceae bacterium]